MSKAANGLENEHHAQARFVAWFRKTYPGTLIFAIPNGGHRNKVTAMKLKAEGVVPGVPDLFVPRWFLWIEFKRAQGGTVSKHQKDIMAQLEAAGHYTFVARGYDDAIEKTLLFKCEN